MKKVFLLMSLVFFMFMSTKVYAMGDGTFDAEYYANKYPDVVEVFGTDAEDLYNHFLTYGFYEGRFQNAEEERTGIHNPAVVPIMDGYTTYVDVSIVNQLVTYFEDGEIKFQSPCVTGNEKAKHGTPEGTYSILAKTPGKYLKGPTWNCWVDRWMRFTEDSIGLHDANWRSEFGKDIYKTNGSHGCVNLPHDKALELYDLISVGTTVIVH